MTHLRLCDERSRNIDCKNAFCKRNFWSFLRTLFTVKPLFILYGSLVFNPSPTNSSDGRVVRAFASGFIDLGLISCRVKPMISKLVFTASLLDVEH